MQQTGQQVGEQLKEERKRQGITIKDAAKFTKIRPDYLVEFEKNKFDQELPEIYKRGFVQIYAKYLKLDVDKLITDYNYQLLDQKSSTRSSTEGGNDLGTVKLENTSRDTSSEYKSHYVNGPETEDGEASQGTYDKTIYWKMGIILGLLILVFVLLITFISLLSSGGDTQKPAATAQSSDTATPAEQSNQPANNTSAIGSASTYTITLTANEDCVVRVRNPKTGENLVSRGFQAGESQTLESEAPELMVITTKAEALEIMKNGKKLSHNAEGTARIRLQRD